MSQSVDIQPRYLKMVQDILQQYLPLTATVYAFGSRAKGHAKKFSDLDLVVDNGKRLDTSLITRIAFNLEESSLPFKVDIVDWHAISDSFKCIIADDRITIWRGEENQNT